MRSTKSVQPISGSRERTSGRSFSVTSPKRAESYARHATIDDLAACSEALGRLHRLGIVHGGTNRYNFLINTDGVTMVDFECARRSDDGKAFEVEMENLAEQLQDDSGRDGGFAEAAAV
jgi:tRNA A-37 threonylcarbamoyl transferase component Bud32